MLLLYYIFLLLIHTGNIPNTCLEWGKEALSWPDDLPDANLWCLRKSNSSHEAVEWADEHWTTTPRQLTSFLLAPFCCLYIFRSPITWTFFLNCKFCLVFIHSSMLRQSFQDLNPNDVATVRKSRSCVGKEITAILSYPNHMFNRLRSI